MWVGCCYGVNVWGVMVSMFVIWSRVGISVMVSMCGVCVVGVGMMAIVGCTVDWYNCFF